MADAQGDNKIYMPKVGPRGGSCMTKNINSRAYFKSIKFFSDEQGIRAFQTTTETEGAKPQDFGRFNIATNKSKQFDFGPSETVVGFFGVYTPDSINLIGFVIKDRICVGEQLAKNSDLVVGDEDDIGAGAQGSMGNNVLAGDGEAQNAEVTDGDDEESDNSDIVMIVIIVVSVVIVLVIVIVAVIHKCAAKKRQNQVQSLDGVEMKGRGKGENGPSALPQESEGDYYDTRQGSAAGTAREGELNAAKRSGKV